MLIVQIGEVQHSKPCTAVETGRIRVDALVCLWGAAFEALHGC
jgi:hypothetical protein